jgi:hypothetical protein
MKFLDPSWSWSYGIWIYNYLCNQFLSPLKLWVWIPLVRGVLDTTLCDKVCQWLSAGGWFSPGTLVFSTNETDRHDIAEILLKMALTTMTITPSLVVVSWNACNIDTFWLLIYIYDFFLAFYSFKLLKSKRHYKWKNFCNLLSTRLSNLIQKKNSSVNMKVSGFCYDMHFHYCLPIKKWS